MNITISHTETITKNITLTEKEQREVIIQYIFYKYGISPDMWIEIRDDKKILMKEIQYVTSHKFTIEEEVREASENDEMILNCLKELIST